MGSVRRSGKSVHSQAVFVAPGEPSERDYVTDAEIEEVAAEARGDGDVGVTTFHAAHGRGASGSAIGLLLDLAVGFAPTVVSVAWKRIRHRRPIMSVGALHYLCLADLAQRLEGDSLDDVVNVLACDTVGARPPMPGNEPPLLLGEDESGQGLTSEHDVHAR